MSADDWQPIETAPKDGTWILGLNDRGNCSVIMWSTNALRRDEVGEGWIIPFSTGEISPFWEERVTHWMPLPAPPDTGG